VEDHIHIAVSVPPKLSLSEFVRQIKGNSSHFVNHQIKPDYCFNWQNEYGVISFGQKNLSMVVSYVHNQREHHRNQMVFEQLERINP
jgi:REP element-mobilizing transposase RayT